MYTHLEEVGALDVLLGGGGVVAHVRHQLAGDCLQEAGETLHDEEGEGGLEEDFNNQSICRLFLQVYSHSQEVLYITGLYCEVLKYWYTVYSTGVHSPAS